MDPSANTGTTSDDEIFYDCQDGTQSTAEKHEKNGVKGERGLRDEANIECDSTDVDLTDSLQRLTLRGKEEAKATSSGETVENGKLVNTDVADSTGTLGGSAEQVNDDGKQDQDADVGATPVDLNGCDPIDGSGEQLGQVRNNEPKCELGLTSGSGGSAANGGDNPLGDAGEHPGQDDNTRTIKEGDGHNSIGDTKEHLEIINAEQTAGTVGSGEEHNPLAGTSELGEQADNAKCKLTSGSGASATNGGDRPLGGASEQVDNTQTIGENRGVGPLGGTSVHVNDEQTLGAVGGTEEYNPLAGTSEHAEQAADRDSSDESDDETNLTQEEIDERAEEAKKLKNEGNMAYKSDNLSEAERLYTEGLKICPKCLKKDRAVLYSNRAATFVKMEDKTEPAIADCTNAIELHPTYLKAILRRAQLYEKTEKFEEAIKDYERVLELDSSIHSARAALQHLPEKIEQRNERLKAQMMSSLKDLGNLFLRPFGLSTDNFQMQQDPNSGSYNVQFNNNPAQQNNGAPGNGPTNGR